jgi:hypothetical protein
MEEDGDTPDTSPEAGARRSRYQSALVEAEVELLELTQAAGSSIEDLQAQAEQSRRVWELRALWLASLAQIDLAAKASAQAVKQGELAVKLSKSTLADRVADLERMVAEATQAGGRIRRAGRRRRGA